VSKSWYDIERIAVKFSYIQYILYMFALRFK